MKNIHVPANWPDVLGVHVSERKGIECEVVKTIRIMSDEVEEEELPDMSILS